MRKEEEFYSSRMNFYYVDTPLRRKHALSAYVRIAQALGMVLALVAVDGKIQALGCQTGGPSVVGSQRALHGHQRVAIPVDCARIGRQCALILWQIGGEDVTGGRIQSVALSRFPQ